ncbi:hypothetical protein MHN79_06280 [Vibrio sp. Of14-4]|uniref:hypothetical protein n=1 Tax=Vibrio sp. Of14-4 TaxID=2724878 RepID=UPI001EF291E0|nr:hypothetical protein [Vibrio sp. Of14-4]MCG7489089.1 hypothetical protein [Vibrio sp. Of14-4]
MRIKLALLLCLSSLSTGCIQMPTTASSTVDNRPQVIFKSNSSVDLSRLNVVVDGLDNGSAAHFSNKALRLLPGTHIVEVFDGDELISSQKIYLSDGVTKEVFIK